MKKISLIVAFFLLRYHSFGQVIVGKVDINQNENIKVIEVLIDNRGLGKSVDVTVDYGQTQNIANAIGKRIESRIMDLETKERINFESTGQVINFLENHGWEYHSSLTKENVFFYYFRRDKN